MSKEESSKIEKTRKDVEIMAPAGSYESLQAAINAGADSIYFGIEQLNMRARAANNFTLEDLKKIAKICQEKNINSYLTLNTVLYDHDVTLMKKICDAAKAAEITAVIASDISAISYANSIDLEVHISTQCNVSNIEAVKFYAKFADVIVLARELTLKQIKKICDTIKEENITGPKGNLVEIELFAHGALCVAISGKCYMSLGTYNASANRGACLQNCRRSYRVIDEETGDELVLDNKYVMSPKDLCTIGFVDQILDAGVRVLKFEGRGRSPDYVDTVIRTYREAVDQYLAGTYSQNKEEKVAKWTKELEKVFNRGFWHGGYYLGKELGEWSGVYGSKASEEKVFLGVAKNYFKQVGVAEFFFEAGKVELKIGDRFLVTGPTTGVIRGEVSSLRLDDKEVQSVQKGDDFTLPVAEQVRPQDKLFLIRKAKQEVQEGKQKSNVVLPW